jgi:GDP-L-fucose synthase
MSDKLYVKSSDLPQRRRDAEKRRENQEKAQQEPALQLLCEPLRRCVSASALPIFKQFLKESRRTKTLTNCWPDSAQFWQDKRVIVTGGGGFLGSVVVRKLHARGAAAVIVPRQEEYDLTQIEAVRRLLADTAQPAPVDMVIHLAAKVGGIGANRARPGEFFYDNLMMGVQLMHEVARQAGVAKFVARARSAPIPSSRRSPSARRTLWDGYPEETNAPYGLAKKMLLVQSQAYRQQYGYNSIYLLPVNLYGPGDNFDPRNVARDPGADPQVRGREATCGARRSIVWGDGSPTREFLYVDDAAEGIVLAASATMAASR